MCNGQELITWDASGGYKSLCIQSDGTSIVSDTDVDQLRDLDTMWFIIMGVLVFFMQLGFTMLEVGAVRAKNVENILFKNLGDACIGAVVWFILGWAFAYGVSDDPNEFIGNEDFAVHEHEYFREWFFQWCFAATAATIVSGAVAERIELHAYFCYTVLMTGFIYPVVVYWVWSGEGWLTYGKDYGIIDFAGSGVVHMVGGFCALAGAVVAGPRKGSIEVHSVPFQVFGTLILWFGWYGFNCGSTLGAQNGALNVAERVAVTTTLGAASGGLSAMILNKVIHDYWSAVYTCNGILAGLVSITANCHVISPGAAIVIGGLGGMFYTGASFALKKIEY
eukprot:UN25555